MSKKFWHEEAVKNLNMARRWRARLQPGMTTDEALHIMRQVVGYVYKARLVNKLTIEPDKRRTT